MPLSGRLASPPKIQLQQTGDGAAQGCSFHEKQAHRMFESVMQMLEQLTWIPLTKRRENSRLILFYKSINNLAVVPHSCLEKADVRTRKNHTQKFCHIGYNVDPYGLWTNSISAWNGLAKTLQRPTL